MEDLLRAAPVENPEDNLMITPLDKGSLVHAALEEFLLRGARPAGRRPARRRTTLDGNRPCAAAPDRRRPSATSTRPRASSAARIFWTRDRRRILADLDHALTHDSAHRRTHGTAPIAAELGFGFVGESLDAVEVTLPDGRVLRVRGRIDRVDVGADGTVHVIDYKTGSATGGYKELLRRAIPSAGGTKLQLPIYGLAGRLAARRRRGGRAGRVLVRHLQGRLQARRGYDITAEVLETTIEVLDVIVRGVEGGVFPPHPDALSTFLWVACHVCDPDGLGTAELRKQWDRKRHDPALREYADLAEPLEDVTS